MWNIELRFWAGFTNIQLANHCASANRKQIEQIIELQLNLLRMLCFKLSLPSNIHKVYSTEWGWLRVPRLSNITFAYAYIEYFNLYIEQMKLSLMRWTALIATIHLKLSAYTWFEDSTTQQNGITGCCNILKLVWECESVAATPQPLNMLCNFKTEISKSLLCLSCRECDRNAVYVSKSEKCVMKPRYANFNTDLLLSPTALRFCKHIL